ncbi:MAG: ABC transporter permease [Gammaproteobacteria bacterium]|nr:MAG: ABC transporter permease [Gammaproteobacteria bacterium]
MQEPGLLLISLPRLALAFVPALAVVLVLWRWNTGAGTALYGLLRMLVQLLLVGFALAWIFGTRRAGVVVGVLALMLGAAAWIALRTSGGGRRGLYAYSLAAIALGGGTVLALVTAGVLALHPWYAPRYLVPLGGMVFANAMNSVSLAVERVQAELGRGRPWPAARGIALRAALIPTLNALFAVGLVSLPGMMTGQILSGVSPFVAARYQIMVLCMVFGASGLSAALFLALSKGRLQRDARPTE